MSVYPATNSNEAVELIIDGGNQLHDIINEAADKTVTTESGEIPSVRKAIADSLMFLEPLPWKQGESETNFLQIRSFNSELYWAPSATVNTPKPMGVSPIGDSNWKLAPLRLSKSSILSALGKVNKGFWDENPKLGSRDDFVVERNTGNVFGAIVLPYQVDSATHPAPNALVGTELVDVSQFVSDGGTEIKEELLQIKASLLPKASDGSVAPVGTTHIELNDELFQLSKVASGVISNIKYNDEGNPYSAAFASATVSLIQARIPDTVAYGKAFGMVANGTADDTEMFWNALDWLKERGGGRLVLDGDIKVSLANSRHDKVCVIIPASVELYSNSGASITRLDSERGQNGILLCNEGYDDPANGGKYSAAGNIIIDGIKISDGASTPKRGLGDLIGFGNGDGLVVQNCDFGNHDQHAVDVAKSRNFVIRNNDSKNAVDAPASATYQVDAGLIWGIAGASTSSYDGYIYENDINESLAGNVIHFHSGNQAKNVHIFRNRIKPNSTTRVQNAIGGDTDCGYINCFIFNNEIKMINPKSRCVNLPTQDNTKTIRGLKIFNNTLEGKFRVGIFIGDDNPTRSDTNGPLVSAKVFDNNIRCDLSDGIGSFTDARMIAVSALKKARVYNNEIDVTKGTSKIDIRYIEDRNVENFFCYGNDLISDFTTTSGNVSCILSSFDLHLKNDLRTIKEIKDNFINVVGANYFIEINDPGDIGNYTKLQGVISGNRMPQTPKSSGAHIKEITPLSDGTNNLGYINFVGHGALASDPFILPITKATAYLNLPLTGKKQAKTANKRASANKIEILYSPNSPDFGADTETINTVYLSPTTCAGVLIKDVSLPDGHFDIITGSEGVSMVINDSSFQPVIRDGGWIKILAGI
tara:strand:- start:35285 stop:37903 length:2619 start_codon:yes stop_codon:yes gene_type:complete